MSQELESITGYTVIILALPGATPLGLPEETEPATYRYQIPVDKLPLAVDIRSTWDFLLRDLMITSKPFFRQTIKVQTRTLHPFYNFSF